MFSFFLIVFLAVAASASPSVPKAVTAFPLQDTKIEEHPYQVYLVSDGRYLCGGAIISTKHVITTASCIPQGITNLMVHAESTYFNSGGYDRLVTAFVRHENYTVMEEILKRPVNDIAVLEIDQPFQFNNRCQPIQLFESNKEISGGSYSGTIGWYTLQKPLQIYNTTIVSKRSCNRLVSPYGSMIFANGQICEVKEYMQLDRGNPMVVDGRLAGIVCWGRLQITVGTEIAAYRDWIAKYSDVSNNFTPKLSASLFLILLVQVSFGIISF